jgi:hypothetical protein
MLRLKLWTTLFREEFSMLDSAGLLLVTRHAGKGPFNTLHNPLKPNCSLR